MPRVLLAAMMAAALLAAPASADVRHGPSGARFYKPTKHLHGAHGALYWWRKQTGSDALKSAKRNALLLYRSAGNTLVSGSVAFPKG